MARPRRPDEVPVGPLREAFERSGLSTNEVARRAGWLRHYVARNGRVRKMGDSTRVRRGLGLVATQGGWVRTHLTYDEAVALARALDVDPVDVGV